jgi:hypothetical protein
VVRAVGDRHGLTGANHPNDRTRREVRSLNGYPVRLAAPRAGGRME